MYLWTYFIALVIFLIIDMVWLGVLAKKLYARHLGYIMAKKVDWFAAIVFYLLFILGLVVFVINPALDAGIWTHALGYGALFGLITYATYDLTNQATLEGWPKILTLIDLMWGMFIAASVSALTYVIAAMLF